MEATSTALSRIYLLSDPAVYGTKQTNNQAVSIIMLYMLDCLNNGFFSHFDYRGQMYVSPFAIELLAQNAILFQ